MTADKHGWLPIETAPKDGTVVDLWCVHPQHPACMSRDMLFEREKWRSDRWGDELNPGWEATHWHPMPAPPVQP